MRFFIALLFVAVCSGSADDETRNLFDAVNRDDADGVHAALAKGARINERRAAYNAGHQTPLMAASLGGKPAAAAALVAGKTTALPKNITTLHNITKHKTLFRAQRALTRPLARRTGIRRSMAQGFRAGLTLRRSC